jgi:26S proteasome regulatory subunit N2
MFGYPPHIKNDEKKVAEKKTVKLSTTDKVKAKISKRDADKQGVQLEQSSLGQGESKLSLGGEQNSQ